MARLVWGNVGERFYEVGVDRGVLYVGDNAGVAWSGIVSINESPSGGEAKPYYLDGVKYLNLSTTEEFAANIEAFYSPAEFDVCDGMVLANPGLYAANQRRKPFGLSYRTKVGNDLIGEQFAYKIHIIYNALAEPTQQSHESMGDNPEVPLLSWAITTKPVLVPGVGYSSHLVVDSKTATPYALSLLEDILYGDESNFPRLPTVEELVLMFEDAEPLTVTDAGDGTFVISGSGLAVRMINDDEYEITSDTVVAIDEEVYEISSE